MEIQRLSFCRSCGSSSPWVLKYFASSHRKERERTGNVHLLLNYLILEMTQELLLHIPLAWVSHTILRKFREKERHKLWCTVSCLFHHPNLWPLNICEYPSSYPWNKVISPSSQLNLTFSNFFIQLKVQKNLSPLHQVWMLLFIIQCLCLFPKIDCNIGSNLNHSFICILGHFAVSGSLWMKIYTHPLTLSSATWFALTSGSVEDKL